MTVAERKEVLIGESHSFQEERTGVTLCIWTLKTKSYTQRRDPRRRCPAWSEIGVQLDPKRLSRLAGIRNVMKLERPETVVDRGKFSPVEDSPSVSLEGISDLAPVGLGYVVFDHRERWQESVDGLDESGELLVAAERSSLRELPVADRE